MRVWIVNQYAVPPSQAGITRHHTLASELIKRGHEVTIIASSFDHVTRTETRLGPGERARVEVVAQVPFVWLKTPPYRGNSLRRMANMAAFAASVGREVPRLGLDRPEVIIGSSPHLFGAWAAVPLGE